MVKLWRAYCARRYFFLFYSLLATLAALPVLTALKLNATIIEFFLALSLLAAIVPLGSGRTRLPLLGLVVMILLARALVSGANQGLVNQSALGLWSVIGLLAAAGCMRFVIKADDVDREHVYAALSAYLLAGCFFGLAYWSVELTWPGSFAGPDEFNRESAIYFSFVTLASLGYGDFLPRTDIARGLATFEVIGGQLFLAVLVARLISVYAVPTKK